MNKLLRVIIVLSILCALPATAICDIFYDTYQHGLAAFKAKDYRAARADFLRAYDLRPEPVILFNVAQTYRLELQAEQALMYYKRFLAETKIAEDLREEAQAYVSELEAEQRVREIQEKLEADLGPKERDGTPVKMTTPPMSQTPLRASSSLSSDSALNTDNEVARSSSPVWSIRRKIALGTAGGGGLALAVGVALGMSAKVKQTDAHMLCPDPQVACAKSGQANTLIRAGHNLAIGANVAFGIGALAAVAAGVLWFTGAPASYHRVSLAPDASPGHVAIVARGSF